MTHNYPIQLRFNREWQQGLGVAQELLAATETGRGTSYYPVHGDPILAQLDDRDLVCYFVYTLSSWWEIPLIDRINMERLDNNFAILMDINPAPETIYRLTHSDPQTPETRYREGLRQMFPSLESTVAGAMFRHLRNGFGHNLFGREPSKIQFDNAFDCPPLLDADNVLLVPPIKLALSMVKAFLPKIALLLLYPSLDQMRIFKHYMTGRA